MTDIKIIKNIASDLMDLEPFFYKNGSVEFFVNSMLFLVKNVCFIRELYYWETRPSSNVLHVENLTKFQQQLTPGPQLNPLMLTAAKTSLTILIKSFRLEHNWQNI